MEERHAGGVPAWCSGARQSANCLATIRDRTALSFFWWRQRKVQWTCGEVDKWGYLQVLSSGESRRFPMGKRRPMSATQPEGGVTTGHEFVVNGWIRIFVSADPFCSLETSTSNRQPNGHDHGKVSAPMSRAEVWSEVFLPACLTPPSEVECAGAFRSFCPNCCIVRSVDQDLAAATQGGRRSKGWPQDRLSLGRGRAGETAHGGLRRPSGLYCPFLDKDTDVKSSDKATTQPQHTHATTGTRSSCHYSPHNARAWRLARAHVCRQ